LTYGMGDVRASLRLRRPDTILKERVGVSWLSSYDRT
jgi:hypothetical protein